MYRSTTNHGKHGGAPRALLHRSFHLHGAPRILILCRLLGHRPIVDGYGPIRPGLDAARWVCCDRCGVRPEPQIRLDPDAWAVGDTYRGPCGRWGDTSTDCSVELVVGRSVYVFSLEAKVGNGGSENKLAFHLNLWRVGAVYVSLGTVGTWLQRRLIPTGYDSRVIGIAVDDWRIRWEIWAKKNQWSRDDPWWMQGSISLDLVEKILGPKRYSYKDEGEPVTATVRMPHGDDHAVTLQLQRRTYGRARGRKKRVWSVDWSCDGGIPTKPHSEGGVWGSAVEVSDQAVEAGDWPMVATAAIAARLTMDRTRYGYRRQEVGLL
jgi:hypothetical protein